MNALVERLAVQLDDVAPGTITRHLIFPEGVFHHPEYGVLDFRKPFFEQMVKNFNERVRKVDVPIDLLHQRGEAAGWIQRLDYVPGEGLYADIAWTDLGIEKVKNRRLRYFSPDFGTFEDPRTREKYPNTLFAVTLTNFPFLKELPEVTIPLSELAEVNEAYFLENYPGVPEEDFAGPHRSFPIRTQNDVYDAWRLRGHAANPTEVARNIIRIAKRKGFKLPDNWKEVLGDEPDGETEALAAAPPPAANADRSAPDQEAARRAPRVKRPRGNEGAIQPSAPSGARPHINRSRYPDPTSEVNQMTEQEMQDSPNEVQLEESVRRLTERLSALETENRRLAEELVKARRERLERDIADEARRLSEPGEKYAIPPAVVERYQQFALAEPEKRSAVYELLLELRKTGLVPLAERGHATVDTAHDPDAPRPRDVTLSDVVERAREYARKNGLDWTKLADREAAIRMVMEEGGRA